MGMLKQALAGAGKGLQEIGLLGIQNTMSEARQKRLTTLEGGMRSREAASTREATAEEGRLDRESREKVAGMKATQTGKTPKPDRFTLKDEMGLETQYEVRDGKTYRFDGREWALAKDRLEPVDPTVAEGELSDLVNKYNTWSGWDIDELGMRDEDDAVALLRPLRIAGMPIEKIDAALTQTQGNVPATYELLTQDQTQRTEEAPPAGTLKTPSAATEETQAMVRAKMAGQPSEPAGPRSSEVDTVKAAKTGRQALAQVRRVLRNDGTPNVDNLQNALSYAESTMRMPDVVKQLRETLDRMQDKGPRSQTPSYPFLGG